MLRCCQRRAGVAYDADRVVEIFRDGGGRADLANIGTGDVVCGTRLCVVGDPPPSRPSPGVRWTAVRAVREGEASPPSRPSPGVRWMKI